MDLVCEAARSRPATNPLPGDQTLRCPMKLAYFVHDLADAAVHRRVRMLRDSAEITLLGFHRSDTFPRDLDGIRTVSLGRTVDARLAQRAAMVTRALVGLSSWRHHLDGSTIFLARQLEMLVLAAWARQRVAPRAPLVFECLDIHRLMLTANPVGAGLRLLEGGLLRVCSLLLVSSPAFFGHHFARYGAALPPHLLVENKVVAKDVPPPLLAAIAAIRAGGPPPGPPWRVGWFGMIRCRRSLDLLARLARALPGQVEVVIRGRPRRDVIPDFDAIVLQVPGLSFRGQYDRHTDLPAIYGEVHFTWAADFFEAGQNSAWLLPNRLYEGTLYGAVPLVPASVETGRWLQERRCGVLLDGLDDVQFFQSLVTWFRDLDSGGYRAARAALARVPLADVLDDPPSCRRFGDVLNDLRRGGPQ